MLRFRAPLLVVLAVPIFGACTTQGGEIPNPFGTGDGDGDGDGDGGSSCGDGVVDPSEQ